MTTAQIIIIVSFTIVNFSAIIGLLLSDKVWKRIVAFLMMYPLVVTFVLLAHVAKTNNERLKSDATPIRVETDFSIDSSTFKTKK